MEEDKSLKKFWLAAFWPFVTLVVMWLVWYFDRSADLNLYKYGIYPMELSGLKGILFSPLIHDTDDFAHIVNNSVPLIVLMWALFYFYREVAWKVFALIWIVGGLCVWISARDSFHIGMSGVLYGMAAFLFFSGVIRQNINLLAISMLVAFEYGSMVWGVLPYKQGMSFEGHFWGAAVGLAMAFVYRKRGPQKKKYQWQIDEEEDEKRLQEAEEKFGEEYWKGQSNSQSQSESQSRAVDDLRKDPSARKVKYIYKSRKD